MPILYITKHKSKPESGSFFETINSEIYPYITVNEELSGSKYYPFTNEVIEFFLSEYPDHCFFVDENQTFVFFNYRFGLEFNYSSTSSPKTKYFSLIEKI